MIRPGAIGDGASSRGTAGLTLGGQLVAQIEERVQLAVLLCRQGCAGASYEVGEVEPEIGDQVPERFDFSGQIRNVGDSFAQRESCGAVEQGS